MIHGCIDGYSRLVVYLHCADSNRADYVVQVFREAVHLYRLPSRVRGDRGGVNVNVADLMIAERGARRGNFICGYIVSITNGLNACGEISSVVAQCCITSCLSIWKRMAYSTLMTKCNCSACTTSSCHASMTVCSSLSRRGITTLCGLNLTCHLCNYG